MNTQFKAKFLNHLTQRKNSEKGFTLIELLVVIIIIGILSAIALPAFLNQANKAKQSEAKQYVGTMMRTQQAFYLEKAAFATDLDTLGRPIVSATDNYKYEITAADVVGAGTPAETVNVHGESLKPALKSYVGGVALLKVQTTSEATTGAMLCEAKEPKPGRMTAIGQGVIAAGDVTAACNSVTGVPVGK